MTAIVVWLERAFRRARSTAHGASNMDTALSQPLVSHHEGSQTNGVTVGRPITGRTSGRPIRTPPPAAPPLARGITVGRSAIGTRDKPMTTHRPPPNDPVPAALNDAQYALPGTLARRYMRCGKENCRC